MANPKEKLAAARPVKPKKLLGLKVPSIRMPHEDLIKKIDEIEPIQENAPTNTLTEFTENRVPLELSSMDLAPSEPSSISIEPIEPRPIRTEPKQLNTGQQEPSSGRTKLRQSQEAFYQLPNRFHDEILPLLQPFEQLVLLRLYRLSAGFNKQVTDPVSYSKLAEKTNLSQSSVKRALASLEQRKLIAITGDKKHNPMAGNQYMVLLDLGRYELSPERTKLSQHSPERTKFPGNYIKDHDHEDLKIHDHQSAHECETMTIYQSITGNKWNKADHSAYEKIKEVSLEIIDATMRAVKARAAQKPGSLHYFIKEILAAANPTPATRKAHRAQLQPIIDRVRASYAGGRYDFADLEDRVRAICERDGVVFDKQIFNEIVS